ncbi:hypothetical protein [Acuticoccus kandeliae]|uniref:hypothetical protein n=1 Tax=Acuticoccus kandeliae TaxID=2073160 RepID=UPI000D3EA2BC|nr:hypothetical protein [Acuticoccus kandeliae]
MGFIMSDSDALKDRLDQFKKRLDDATKKLAMKGRLRNANHLTSGELQARHAFLQSELDKGIVALDAQGDRVGVLEADFMDWLNQIDLEDGKY